MGRVIIGINARLQGAVAILADSDALIDVQDMPCLNDGPAKRRSANAALLSQLIAESHTTEAYVELVGPRRQEGSVAAFAFGRSRGAVEGVLAALGVPVALLPPPRRKRPIGIAPGKAGAEDAARSEAIRRWPDKAGHFARKRDDCRAEACLVAAAGPNRSRI
jgi:crossover junction endodeoxyribonuclease RuvC